MTALRNKIVLKAEPRINSYLSAYKIPHEKLTLAEKTREVAKNIMALSHAFEAKAPAFKKIRNTNKYYESFENFLDQNEEDHNFEGFDNGDQSQEDQHFLPIALAAGKFIAKGGLKKIAQKAKGLISKVSEKLKSKASSEPETKQSGIQQLAPDVAFNKLRDNVLDHGVDVWLTEKKKKTLDKLIKESDQKKFSNDVKQALISLNMSPNKFRNYMDENGDFTGENGQKLDKILKEILAGDLDSRPQQIETVNQYRGLYIVGTILIVLGVGYYISK